MSMFKHLLEPFFNMIQHIHWYGIYHYHFTVIVFEYKHHVKVLQMKSNAFKVDKLHVFKRDNERRLRDIKIKRILKYKSIN